MPTDFASTSTRLAQALAAVDTLKTQEARATDWLSQQDDVPLKNALRETLAADGQPVWTRRSWTRRWP